MTRFRRSTVGAAGLAALLLLPAAGFAASEHYEPGGKAAAQVTPEEVRFAHMAGMGGGMAGGPAMMAQGQGFGPGPCQGYMPGYGMGPGTMGQGMSPGMTGSGMMGSGMMGQGMPGQGYGMGPGMMGPGVGQGMGPGMMAPGYGYGPQPGYGMGPGAVPDQDLSVDDVRARFERSLSWHGNPRLAVGDVTETDENTITAEIVTKDGSLVQRFVVDRQSGAMRMVE